MSLRTFFGLLALVVLSAPAMAAEPDFPALTGRVVDRAGVLSPTVAGEISQIAAQHEKASGQQIVVVTLQSLQGYDIADYGYRLGRHWGIGRQGEDNGVLLIVAPEEREVRIEVGYGLEGALPDAIAHDIVSNVILPEFRRGDLQAGILAGTKAIVQALEGSYEPGSSGEARKDGSVAKIMFLLLVFGVVMGFSFMARSGHSRYYRRRGGFLGGIGTGGGGFSGGFGGGGGFSGGGGSFGGGGASGSW